MVYLFRIGGGRIENLRLKTQERNMIPPGISVLEEESAAAAAGQMRAAFPDAARLHESTRVVGSATREAVRAAGFDVLPDPTRRFPNHHRINHPAGVAGFDDASLERLAIAFTDVTLED